MLEIYLNIIFKLLYLPGPTLTSRFLHTLKQEKNEIKTINKERTGKLLNQMIYQIY